MPFEFQSYSGPSQNTDDTPLTNQERLIIAVCFFAASALSIAISAVGNNAQDFALSELKKEGVYINTPQDFKKYQKKIDSLESVYNHK